MMGKWLDFTVNSVNAVLMIPTLKTCTWREEGTDFSTRWDTRHLVNQDHALVAWNNLHTTFTRRRQALHVLLCDPQTNTVHKLPDILSLMTAATGWRQVPIFETIQLQTFIMLRKYVAKGRTYIWLTCTVFDQCVMIVLSGFFDRSLPCVSVEESQPWTPCRDQAQ